MQLQLDTGRKYALALEGGGAKGSYQVGAWRALREAGIEVCAVSGTSVGALNGALIVAGDLEKAEKVWREIRYSQVMNVDDDVMQKLVRGDLRGLDFHAALRDLRGIVQSRGFDVTPLYEWMKTIVDEDTIRNSPTELFFVTYDLKEQRELELRAKDLPQGTLHDMLLASSYLPVFHSDRLAGMHLADGGFRDVLPLHVLFENGYRDVIALRLFGVGIERKTEIPRTARVHTVAPTFDLGGTLDFSAEHSAVNMRAGYFDAKRMLYGLRGTAYYIDSQWDERQAYTHMAGRILRAAENNGRTLTLRELNETVLPRIAQRLGARRGDYSELFIAASEAAAAERGIDRWQIYTEEELLGLLGGHDIPAAAERVLREKHGIQISLP